MKFIKVVVKYFLVGVDFNCLFDLYFSSLIVFCGEDGCLIDEFFMILDDCMFGEVGVVLLFLWVRGLDEF